METKILLQNGNKKECINLLKYHSREFFVNGRRYKYEKGISIIENNYSDTAKFTVRKKVRRLKFWKGDFRHFKGNYSTNPNFNGFMNIGVIIYYVDVIK